MSTNYGSRIVQDGLVVNYDVSNLKSYKGPPIQNLADRIQIDYGTGTGFSFIAGSEVVDIPQIGKVTTPYCLIQNNYPSVSPLCCPHPFSYTTTSTAVLPSTLYTYGILYKTESQYTNANYLYRIEYTSGSVYIGEAALFGEAIKTYLGNGWYWAVGTFITTATTGLLWTGSYYYLYGTSTDKFSVAKVLLAKGDYIGMHPKYWPDYGTTRSVSQSMYDLGGSTTADVTNVNFDIYGSPYFEEGTTNMLPNGLQTFVGWTQYSGATVTVTQGQTDPFGGTKATRLQSSGGTTLWKYYHGNTATVNGTTYTGSMWIKNQGSGTITLGNNIGGSSSSIPPGAFTFVSFSTVSNGVAYQLGFVTQNISDIFDIVVYHPQIEAKAYATSYRDPAFGARPDGKISTTLTTNTICNNGIDRTWEVVVKPSNINQMGIFGHVSSTGCSYFCNGGIVLWNGTYQFSWFDNVSYQWLDSGITAVVGQYVAITATWTTDLKIRIYINGVLKATSAITNMNYQSVQYYMNIGMCSAFGQYFNGQIPIAKYYYNKCLNDTEVLQNFNSIRGRFGL